MKLKQIRVDGYKNLINCEVNLGDFNVLVGPNNGGKSNFLKVLPTLLGILWGQETLTVVREGIVGRSSPDFCNLIGQKKKDLTIKIVFDTKLKKRSWRIQYDVYIKRKASHVKNSGNKVYIEKENLKGKPPNRRGPWNNFLNREPEILRITTENVSKEHAISPAVSALEFVNSVYPKLDDLGKEFKSIMSALIRVCDTYILALDPSLLRRALGEESPIVPWMRLPYFDILMSVDKIHDDEKLYRLFEDTVCDILDFEGLHFVGKDIHANSKGTGKGEFVKRLRSLAIKKKGTSYTSIENYSDGTLATIAILAVLFSEDRSPSSMLCIEEPENYLHPRALEKLVSFLKDHSEDWPVLITTHSPYLLNCVNPEDVNVAVVDETGAAHFEKVSNTKQLRDYLKSGFMSFGDMLASNFEDVLEK